MTQTFLQSMKRSFADVPLDTSNDNAISTAEFLEASESLAGLFDAMGSVAFTPVKNDILGNVKKVRERFMAHPAQSASLQDLVKHELQTDPKKHPATEGLLWLNRGLEFTAQGIRHNVAHSQEELSASFQHAYKNTLKEHHSFLIKPIFSAAMSATPYRKDFYPKLHDNEEERPALLETWLSALEQRVGVLHQFLKEKGIEKK